MRAVLTPMVIAALAGAGVVLAVPAPPRPAALRGATGTVVVREVDETGASGTSDGLLRRWRPLAAVLAGAGAAVLLGGPIAVPAGLAAGAGTWVLAGRIEPAAHRRRREAVRRDLPAVVTLLGAALRSGLDAAAAVELVCRALPGPAADRLTTTGARLRLGGDASEAWAGLGHDPELAPLGRTLARAHRTGAPVVAAVERLADDLAARARAVTEDQARAVGVRAAVPLGLCLLPAFLLLGIVPLAVALAGTIV